MKRRIVREKSFDLVAPYYPRQNPAEKFGILRGVEKQPDGSMTLPWYEYHSVVTEFIQGFYDRQLNVVFDWGKWKRGEKLFADPSLIARATVVDCSKLITLCVHKDRFRDGFMAEALERGVIMACLKRLRDLYPSG
ncbi:MAG: DUF6508 domain-containing protein [Candidatus Binataceae bacterium]